LPAAARSRPPTIVVLISFSAGVKDRGHHVHGRQGRLDGTRRLAELPLSLRLIREMHARLLRSARGGSKNPGEFRRSQNWIGGTRPGNALFVPPPVTELAACLDQFERFMHEDASRLPPLIKAALLHVQFETLHPFLDGNGRIGRLLVTLYLCAERVLQKPPLYLSLYLKAHRADYYRLLQEVREQGAWEAWLEFFLVGVAETANQAFDAANKIVALFKRDRERITSQSERAGSAPDSRSAPAEPVRNRGRTRQADRPHGADRQCSPRGPAAARHR
jgi:Fic family protein